LLIRIVNNLKIFEKSRSSIEQFFNEIMSDYFTTFNNSGPLSLIKYEIGLIAKLV